MLPEKPHLETACNDIRTLLLTHRSSQQNINKDNDLIMLKFKRPCSNKRETNILAVLRLQIPFETDAFRFNLFGTFRGMTFKHV